MAVSVNPTTFREKLAEFKRRAVAAHDEPARLALCREFATYRLVDHRCKSYAERREQWANRTQKMHRHDWRGQTCFVCHGAATQRHHIIALINGGLPTKRNTVWIDAKCHARIHPWMVT
jgi:hypothetical protein